MRIKNITESTRFFSAVSQCNGRVELLTSEGDRLNLKSTLCQYIALTQMFQDKNIEGVELALSDPHDFSMLAEFIVTE
ncbi:MAG: polya polymerase [Christensenellaceae bacterium]|jgi:hypothetical protein|nr:polya polymerase [Christensenellaceae bacterium]